MKPLPFLQRRRARGVTLIEALVALMVMSFGMVAMVGLLANLRRSNDVGKQRSEAMRMALTEMARTRSFSTLVNPDPSDTSVVDYAGLSTWTNTVTRTLTDSNTSYSLMRTVTDVGDGQRAWGKSTQIEVSWVDRASQSGDPAQKIVLNSFVARIDPAFAGAAGIAPPPGLLRQPQNRQPAIPPAATDLGNGTSALRPSSLSSTVWVFNNSTGAITRTCSIDPATALSITSVNDTACTAAMGFLISGTINFSYSNPANPTTPEGTAAGLALDMTITGGSYLSARLTTSGVPERDANGNVMWDSVTVAAPSFQCFDDAPSSQAFLTYSCLVVPATGTSPASWSGALKITGLSLGTTASDYRVCRYSADYNRNGNPYANVKLEPDNYEHPGFYVKVTGSLARQNFLIIRGDASCPSAPAFNLDNGVFADYSTVQLQP